MQENAILIEVFTKPCGGIANCMHESVKCSKLLPTEKVYCRRYISLIIVVYNFKIVTLFSLCALCFHYSYFTLLIYSSITPVIFVLFFLFFFSFSIPSKNCIEYRE